MHPHDAGGSSGIPLCGRNITGGAAGAPKWLRSSNKHLKKTELVTNQLYTNIKRQKHIHESLPYYQKEGATLTAYSPLGHRGLTNLKGKFYENIKKVADAHSATIQQIAIAWLINHENVITIPKAFQIKHLEENAEAVNIKLSKEELELFYTI